MRYRAAEKREIIYLVHAMSLRIFDRRWVPLLISLMLVPISGLSSETGKEREAKQAELDTICEAARQEKLKVIRAEYVEECVEKKQRQDRASCERFYADYGESSAANQVPLFYDLPECVKADQYRRSYRNPDR